MTNNNPEIILKLFDTLKESTDKNEATMKTLISQQQALVDHVKHMPVSELRQEVKDHVVSAQAERKVIKETIETKSEDILEKARLIDTKIGKMIVVVLAAFTIIAGGAWIIKAVSDSTNPSWETRLEEIESEQEKKLMDSIDEIKEEMKKYHKKP